MKNNDTWINLFLFFLITDKPETLLDLIQSDNCEEEFMDIVREVITMNPHHLQRNCVDWLMEHKEKVIELNEVYKTTQKECDKNEDNRQNN